MNTTKRTLTDYSMLTEAEHHALPQEEQDEIIERLIAVRVCLQTNDAVCGVAAAEISLMVPAYLVPQMWGQYAYQIENLRKEKKEGHQHGAEIH